MKQLLLALALALVFVMGREATAPPPPTAEAAPPDFLIQKSCTSNSVAIGATVTCTITITPSPAAFCGCMPYPVILEVKPQDTGTGPNPEYGRARIDPSSTAIGTGPAPPAVDPPIIVNPADGTTQSMTIQCTTTAPSCDFGTPFDSIVITEVLRGLVGGLVTETFKWPAFFPPVPPDLLQTITVLPATVGVGVTCTPNTIVNNSGATGATNCTATFSDNDIFPSTVASGNVTLTLVSATGAVFTSTGAPTASFRCGATNNAPQGCSTVNFSIQSNPPAPATAVAPGTATTRPATTSAPAVGAIGVQVAFTPDLPGVNNQLVTTVTTCLT